MIQNTKHKPVQAEAPSDEQVNPLRKIVEELIPASDGFARRKVRLECGHEVWCSGAAIYRARCRHCRDVPAHSPASGAVERELFEAAHPEYDFTRKAGAASKDYRNSYVQGTWEGWQARAALATQPLEQKPELLLDGLTAHEFVLRELHAFQEATGCDTASQLAQPEQVAQEDSELLDWLGTEYGSNLISDDRGKWALSTTGMQPVPPEGGFDEPVNIVSIVFPEEWHASPRDAIRAARASGQEGSSHG